MPPAKLRRRAPPRLRNAPGRRTALALLAALAAAPAAAQAPLTFGRFDFNFSNPGARSLGFGGAFAALADDATAAFANPAGLVQLARPEVSFETRLWMRRPSFIAGGRTDGTPTGIGLDTRSGLVYGHDHNQSFGPSFAAVVLPRGRWSFALYGHRLARYELDAESQGFFVDGDFFGNPGTTRFPASREHVDLDIVTAGAAASWRASERLSLGVALVQARTRLHTRSEIFLPDAAQGAQAVFGASSFLPARRIATSGLAVEGSDLTVNAGVLWNVSDRVSAAVVYRQGPRADGTSRLEVAAQDELPAVDQDLPVDFHAPDVLGAGLAVRAADGRLTFTGEVDRVGYSGLVTVHETESVVVFGRDYFDAWEYHAGAELALLGRQPVLAVRLGGWVETKDDTGRGNRTHLAAGVGVAGRTFQLDLAADLSREVDTVSLSLIYSF